MEKFLKEGRKKVYASIIKEKVEKFNKLTLKSEKIKKRNKRPSFLPIQRTN